VEDELRMSTTIILVSTYSVRCELHYNGAAGHFAFAFFINDNHSFFLLRTDRSR